MPPPTEATDEPDAADARDSTAADAVRATAAGAALAGELSSPPRGKPRGIRRGWLLAIGAVVWLSGVTLGFAALGRYDTTPGASASAPARWPTSVGIPRAAAGRSTLVLFAHPRCPCTRATMGELEILMARSMGSVDARVVFVRPPGAEPGWERTALWERASKIPGVDVHTDVGGVEATRFGAMTSGAVLLYDASGALRFTGGITASRGHSGDNAGRAAIEALLAGGRGPAPSTPVFGCRLLAPTCAPKGNPCSR